MEHRHDGADAGAGEQERRGVEVGDAVGFHQEDQVAEPRQQRRRDQDAAAPGVEVRRLEGAGRQDADAGPQRGVGEDDVDVEAGPAADQQIEGARRVDGDRTPERVVPAVGPGQSQHAGRDHADGADRAADAVRLRADEVQHEPDPDRGDGADAEVLDLEDEDLELELARGELPGVGNAPVRDGDEEQRVPAGRADATVQHRVDGDRQEHGRPDEERDQRCQHMTDRRSGEA